MNEQELSVMFYNSIHVCLMTSFMHDWTYWTVGKLFMYTIHSIGTGAVMWTACNKCEPTAPSSTQVPCWIRPCFTLSPFSVWQEIVSHAGQTCKQQRTHFQKQNLSETITPIDKSCMLLFNLWTDPVVC